MRSARDTWRAFVVLIDSDILIGYLRGHVPTIARLNSLRSSGTLACSVVTTFEVLKGAKPHQMPRTESFLSGFVHLSVSETIAREAAPEYRYFVSRNVRLALTDLLIGCTARAHGVPLLTGNVRHFPLPGLTLLPP